MKPGRPPHPGTGAAVELVRAGATLREAFASTGTPTRSIWVACQRAGVKATRPCQVCGEMYERVYRGQLCDECREDYGRMIANLRSLIRKIPEAFRESFITAVLTE